MANCHCFLSLWAENAIGKDVSKCTQMQAYKTHRSHHTPQATLCHALATFQPGLTCQKSQRCPLSVVATRTYGAPHRQTHCHHPTLISSQVWGAAWRVNGAVFAKSYYASLIYLSKPSIARFPLTCSANFQNLPSSTLLYFHLSKIFPKNSKAAPHTDQTSLQAKS